METDCRMLSDEQIQKLIQVADGGLKERRRHWCTLGLQINYYYGLDEQFDAVKRLGLSRNQKALDYLKKLNEHKEVNTGRATGPWNNEEIIYVTSYPNSKGELKIVLDEGMHGNSPRQDEARTILRKALSRLEEAV